MTAADMAVAEHRGLIRRQVVSCHRWWRQYGVVARTCQSQRLHHLLAVGIAFGRIARSRFANHLALVRRKPVEVKVAGQMRLDHAHVRSGIGKGQRTSAHLDITDGQRILVRGWRR